MTRIIAICLCFNFSSCWLNTKKVELYTPIISYSDSSLVTNTEIEINSFYLERGLATVNNEIYILIDYLHQLSGEDTSYPFWFEVGKGDSLIVKEEILTLKKSAGNKYTFRPKTVKDYSWYDKFW